MGEAQLVPFINIRLQNYPLFQQLTRQFDDDTNILRAIESGLLFWRVSGGGGSYVMISFSIDWIYP